MPVTDRSCAVLDFIGPDGESDPGDEAFLAATLCNDARVIGRRIAGDPVDAALLRWVQAHGRDVASLRAPHPRLDAVARDRTLTVTCRFDGILRAYSRGAPESIVDSLRGWGFPLPIVEAIDAAPRDTWIVLAGGPLGLSLPVLGLVRLRNIALASAPPFRLVERSRTQG